MNYEYQESMGFGPAMEGEFDHELLENEWAQELMGIQSEEELDHFLGGLLRKAWSGAKALYNSPVGQRLKGQVVSGLKSYGRQVLPGLGQAVGGHFFGSSGAKLGSQFGKMAARGLGMEFEGAPPATRRFEASRRFVKVARNAARRIAAYARSGRPMTARVIRGMILKEGRRWFPALPTSAPYAKSGGYQTADDSYPYYTSKNRGTWYRQGNRIILQGV